MSVLDGRDARTLCRGTGRWLVTAAAGVALAGAALAPARATTQPFGISLTLRHPGAVIRPAADIAPPAAQQAPDALVAVAFPAREAAPRLSVAWPGGATAIGGPVREASSGRMQRTVRASEIRRALREGPQATRVPASTGGRASHPPGPPVYMQVIFE